MGQGHKEEGEVKERGSRRRGTRAREEREDGEESCYTKQKDSRCGFHVDVLLSCLENKRKTKCKRRRGGTA